MEWKIIIHENDEKLESTSWQVLHTNWLWNKIWSEVSFTVSAKWLHVVDASVASHYPRSFGIIPILHKQEAHIWHLTQNSLQYTCFSTSHFADFPFRYSHCIRMQKTGRYHKNKLKNGMYSFFLSLLGKIPRDLTVCCQYRNVRVHAIKKEKVNEHTRKNP